MMSGESYSLGTGEKPKSPSKSPDLENRPISPRPNSPADSASASGEKEGGGGEKTKIISFKWLKKITGNKKDGNNQVNNTMDYDAMLRERYRQVMAYRATSPPSSYYSSSAASFISQHPGVASGIATSNATSNAFGGGSVMGNYRPIDTHGNGGSGFSSFHQYRMQHMDNRNNLDDISSIADTDFGSIASSNTFMSNTSASTEGGAASVISQNMPTTTGKKKIIKKKASSPASPESDAGDRNGTAIPLKKKKKASSNMSASANANANGNANAGGSEGMVNNKNEKSKKSGSVNGKKSPVTDIKRSKSTVIDAETHRLSQSEGETHKSNSYTVDISCVRGFIGGADKGRKGLNSDEVEELMPLLKQDGGGTEYSKNGVTKGKKEKSKSSGGMPLSSHVPAPFYWYHAWNPLDVIVAVFVRPSSSMSSSSSSSSSHALAVEYYDPFTTIDPPLYTTFVNPINEHCADGLVALAVLWSLCYTTYNTLSLYGNEDVIDLLSGQGWKGLLNDTNGDRITCIFHVALGYFVSRSVSSTWSRWKKMRESMLNTTRLTRTHEGSLKHRKSLSNTGNTLGYIETPKTSTLHKFFVLVMKGLLFSFPILWITFGVGLLVGYLSPDSVIHTQLYSNCVKKWWDTLLFVKNIIVAIRNGEFGQGGGQIYVTDNTCIIPTAEISCALQSCLIFTPVILAYNKSYVLGNILCAMLVVGSVVFRFYRLTNSSFASIETDTAFNEFISDMPLFRLDGVGLGVAAFMFYAYVQQREATSILESESQAIASKNVAVATSSNGRGKSVGTVSPSSGRTSPGKRRSEGNIDYAMEGGMMKSQLASGRRRSDSHDTISTISDYDHIYDSRATVASLSSSAKNASAMLSRNHSRRNIESYNNTNHTLVHREEEEDDDDAVEPEHWSAVFWLLFRWLKVATMGLSFILALFTVVASPNEPPVWLGILIKPLANAMVYRSMCLSLTSLCSAFLLIMTINNSFPSLSALLSSAIFYPLSSLAYPIILSQALAAFFLYSILPSDQGPLWWMQASSSSNTIRLCGYFSFYWLLLVVTLVFSLLISLIVHRPILRIAYNAFR